MAPILYEDRAMLVINKPSGLVAQSSDNDPHSIAHWIDYYEQAVQPPERPRTVHRLDRVTTGAMVLAKNLNSASTLSLQFKQRLVKKTYLAIAYGPAPLRSSQMGTLESNISLDPDGRVKIDSNPPLSDAKTTEARAAYEVVATSEKYPGLSLLRLDLKTGVKHQLRVQLPWHLKVSILGDPLHKPPETVPLGTQPAFLQKLAARHVFLHSSYLEITRYHPKATRIGISAPIPHVFAELCDAAGFPLATHERHGGVFENGRLLDAIPGHRVSAAYHGTWLPFWTVCPLDGSEAEGHTGLEA
ncbi:pseudouridine synthase [Exidia glandulosa HHB12029]|uniref:Pseudouridine synthase n=1 Tax=Exidia glandulosa HHB12029 TaxID=1314781 RepID=A0A165BTA2_EXIGL|nr:pseudouridine synthase [Exidia glandulosa HHB12029]